MVEYWYCTMALCKVGNLRDVCSQGYETPVVHQTVCKLPVHTLRSHCSCVQSMVFWEWYHEVVCFLLGNSPASEFYVPTFWNTVCSIDEDGTVIVFRNVGILNSDAGELPRGKHTKFRTRRKSEIERCHEVAGSRYQRALCHVTHGWSQCERANLKYSL